MKNIKSWFLASMLLGLAFAARATYPINWKAAPPSGKISQRAACAPSTAQIDQQINNIRARLLAGGDVWWDGKNFGKYVAPKVERGQPEVSSIFAGAVWIGGKDSGGSLRLAAMAYRTNGFDFWTGPLEPDEGTTNDTICSYWDKHWRVLGSNIQKHLKAYQQAIAQGQTYNCDEIPLDVKGWPGRGNPYFFELNKFELPKTGQGLAGFYDNPDGPNGADGSYNPCDGDYPIIEIRGCDKPQYPDEMIFWIYNDNGNVHTQSRGSEPIRMEVQVQAFGYATNDEINNMTFQRYKLINRARDFISDMYFAMWLDPDLGCAWDDYIGCDTSRSLMYVYNADELDGRTGCACDDLPATYCDKIPILGCDYFRGPLEIIEDDKGKPIDTIELGMSSFTYYVNGGGEVGPAGSDPTNAQEYYNYITGKWRDGTRYNYGGTGYKASPDRPINFAYTDQPCDKTGWSMYTAAFRGNDFRTLQASGPLKLYPGQVNELIVGVVWVPDQDYPGPCITALQSGDDIAQALFDNCFEITDGPDAPDLDFIELDRELVLIMTNDSITSNNAFEGYTGKVLGIPKGEKDSLYRFQGYKIFQLANKDVSGDELNDPAKARVIIQVDLKDTIAEIYNWKAITDPRTNELIWIPESKTGGKARNEGLRHVFNITDDQFAQGDRRLINHKKYYFRAVAYAYNQFKPFDRTTGVGQKLSYLEGRRNVKIYEPIPRPVVDRVTNAKYGDGAVITRLDGIGCGDNFIDMSNGMRDSLISGLAKGRITYLPGAGPIEVKIFNPLDVVDGEFELTVTDNTPADAKVDPGARWQLKNLKNPSDPVIRSEGSIDQFNEQVIAKYGFSVAMGQVEKPGGNPYVIKSNGYIGSSQTYAKADSAKWLTAIANDPSSTFFKYIDNNDPINSKDIALDPNKVFSALTPFVPYQLCDYRVRKDPRDATGVRNSPYITPAFVSTVSEQLVRPRAYPTNTKNPLGSLNNVDIVFTSDKSKWSRCVVVESALPFYTGRQDNANPFNLALETEKNPAGRVPIQLDLRGKLSVSKYDKDNDGLPDPDGEKDANGNALYGMGWFPGYAIDVESGKRLNIFFGENSCYRASNPLCSPENQIGNDMLWNPNSNFTETNGGQSLYSLFMGGYHFVYVTRTEYDGCETIRKALVANSPSTNIQKANQLVNLTWTALPMLQRNTKLMALGAGETGLIPNDLVVKLRVSNTYQVNTGVGSNNGYPTYQFTILGKQANALSGPTVESALDKINVVPNPYYGYSAYEVSQFSNVVKITNLPANCTVTIYSLDGQFIRQYKRDEVGESTKGRNNAPVLQQQITPALEWDLKNSKSIPVASGVYLIHINAPGLGERVIKWFGIARQFDPSGL